MGSGVQRVKIRYPFSLQQSVAFFTSIALGYVCFVT